MLTRALVSRSALVAMMVVVLLGGLAVVVRALIGRFIEPAARLGEEGMVLVRTGVARALPAQGSAENRALAEVINQLVTQRTRLRRAVFSSPGTAV